MCEFLRVTPRELGQKRIYDPMGLAFLERYMIYKLNKEVEAAKQRGKSNKGKKVIRRN